MLFVMSLRGQTGLSNAGGARCRAPNRSNRSLNVDRVYWN